MAAGLVILALVWLILDRAISAYEECKQKGFIKTDKESK